MQIAPVGLPPRPKPPGAGIGLAGMGGMPAAAPRMGGQPLAAGMSPPVPRLGPVATRSPAGAMGTPIGGVPGMTPPGAPPVAGGMDGGMPGYAPQKSPPPVSLGTMAGRPTGMPPVPPTAPAPAAPLAPTAPLQPDASGVTPPPGTPQPPPAAPPAAPVAPAAAVAPVAPAPRMAEAAPAPAPSGLATITAAPTGTGPGAIGGLRGTPSAIPPIATAAPAGRASGGDKGVVAQGLSLPDPGKLVVPGLDLGPSGDKKVYGEGARKTEKDYQQAAIEAGFDVFDEAGNLTALPLNEGGIIDPAFLASIGLGNNPGLSAKMSELPDLFKQYQTASASGNTTAAKQAQAKIIGNLKAAKQGGLKVDPEALFNFYTSGEGAATWAPPPGEPTQNPPGLEEGTIGEGGEVDLGNLDLDAAKAGLPDQLLKWINENPEAGKSILDYLGGLQSRDDRQLAIDSLQQGLGTLLAEDPTRAAMYDYLEGGPQYALDPATVEKMKTSGRTMYGEGLAGLDADLRAAAGRAGVPTSNLAALSAQGRQALLSRLLEGERSTDIQAALQNQADRQQYFGNLDRAQASLLGPMAAYQGSLASLIAGAPGLANTGNPLAGLAEFRASQEAMDPGALGARDWLPVAATGLGSIMSAVGRK